MIVTALDLEWIQHDPMHKLRYSPEIDGHRAWTDDERAKFEKRYPLGTMQRTTYAAPSTPANGAATWCASVGRLQARQAAPGPAEDRQAPSAARTAHIQTPWDVGPPYGEYVLATGDGKPRSAEGLTNDWRRWSESAGLEGTTLHGLRKMLR